MVLLLSVTRTELHPENGANTYSHVSMNEKLHMIDSVSKALELQETSVVRNVLESQETEDAC